MTQKIIITINGNKRSLNIEAHELLLDVLRKEGYTGVKRGCDEGTCGSCTVLINGISVKSCITLAAQVHGKTVTTIEGIGTRDKPHPLQEAFVHEGAIQCGYCIPGMLLSAKALLDKNNNPTEDEVKTALDGNLCRCTGYRAQIVAVLNAASKMRGEK